MFKHESQTTPHDQSGFDLSPLAAIGLTNLRKNIRRSEFVGEAKLRETKMVILSCRGGQIATAVRGKGSRTTQRSTLS